jgi:hypothetical protein
MECGLRWVGDGMGMRLCEREGKGSKMRGGKIRKGREDKERASRAEQSREGDYALGEVGDEV